MINLRNPIILIVSPLFFAFLETIFSLFYKKFVKFFPIIAFLVNAFILGVNIGSIFNREVIIISKISGINSPISITVAIDKLGLLIAGMTTILGLFVSLYNIFFFKNERDSQFYSLFTLLIGGITWISIAGDLFNLFVAFELICIATFGLVKFNRDKLAADASFKYSVTGILAGIFLLTGVVLLYVATGTLNIADIAVKISSFSFSQKLVPFTFIFLGLAVEGALFPFNGWLPDAHLVAPIGVAAIFSSIMTTSSLYAIMRVAVTIFNYYLVFPIFAIFSVLTLFFGEISAFFQKDIKEMLGFSTIGQTGLIFLAFSVGSDNAIGASFAQLVNHSLCKAMLFLIVGVFTLQTNSGEIESLRGMGYKMKFSSALFVIGAFSLIGLPPFFGFASKLNILILLVDHLSFYKVSYLVIVVSMTLVEASYFFKVIRTLYTKAETDEKILEQPGLLIPIITLGLIIILISIFPQQALSLTKSIASQLVTRSYYLQAVLSSGVK